MLRDLLIDGRTHFADCAADESIATNTLAERLQRLRDTGIIARVRDPDDGRRWIYVPRRPAIELIPVLVDLMTWGIAHTAVEVPPAQVAAAEQRDALIAQITPDSQNPAWSTDEGCPNLTLLLGCPAVTQPSWMARPCA